MRTRDFEKQRRIKEATMRLVLREGIDGTSVSMIAKEADVSPATVYVYYSSKEEMLTDVFRECSRQSFQWLTDRVRPGMSGGELIETLVRSYYSFSTGHVEIFSFTEQFSRCPTLCEKACTEEYCRDLLSLLHLYQEQGIIRRCSDLNMGGILFGPVRFLAMNRGMPPFDNGEQLDELIEMIKTMLLE